VLPAGFVMTAVRIPYRVKVDELPHSLLTPGWREHEAVTQILGRTWLAKTCVLCVPSAIIPEERNYVINPEHRDFRRIESLATHAVPLRSSAQIGFRTKAAVSTLRGEPTRLLHAFFLHES
jgi:hypothetical protein